jgi:hypothetical protein
MHFIVNKVFIDFVFEESIIDVLLLIKCLESFV